MRTRKRTRGKRRSRRRSRMRMRRWDIKEFVEDDD